MFMRLFLNLKFHKIYILAGTIAMIIMAIVPAVSYAANPRFDYVKRQLITSGFDVVAIRKLLTDKRLRLYPITIVAYKAPNWKIIEDKLYSSKSLQFGADYIKANQNTFDKAEQDFGVKKEALAGLIAIETDFGKNVGAYTTFNMLYSRMMHWPAATWKAQADQLIALSKYCLQSKLDCFSIKGSYAGAFGLVQFMPTSLLTYGIDGDGDGVVNLQKPTDAIPSAANFLKAHNWQVDPLAALAHYYGSSVGYPKIVLTYASLLIK